MDIGLLYRDWLNIQNALRQACRWAVTGQTNSLARVESVKQVAANASDGLLSSGQIQVSSVPSGGGSSVSNSAGGASDTVTISVSYDVHLITPIIGHFFPNGVYHINASTTFKNEPFTN